MKAIHTQSSVGKELATVTIRIGKAELRITMPVWWWMSIDCRYAFRRTAIAFSAIVGSDHQVLASIRQILDRTEGEVLTKIEQHMVQQREEIHS